MRPWAWHTTYPFNLARRLPQATLQVSIIGEDGLCRDAYSWDIKGTFKIHLTDDMWEIIDSWLRDLTGRDIRIYCKGLRLLLGDPSFDIAVDEDGDVLVFTGRNGPRMRIDDAWEGEEGHEKPDSPPSDWERAAKDTDSE